MTALDNARAAMHNVTEAWIEIARLQRLIDEQVRIISREHAKIDAYLAVVDHIGKSTIADGTRGMDRGR